MVPDSFTVVPLPTAPAPQETVVTPKDAMHTSAPTHPVVTAVLPKQVRVPVVPTMTQSLVATKDIAQVPQVLPETQMPISAPVVTAHKSATPLVSGTPVSYGTTSPVQMTDIQ